VPPLLISTVVSPTPSEGEYLHLNIDKQSRTTYQSLKQLKQSRQDLTKFYLAKIRNLEKSAHLHREWFLLHWKHSILVASTDWFPDWTWSANDVTRFNIKRIDGL